MITHNPCKISIPEANREIVIRVNIGGSSPFMGGRFPENGSVYCENGIYGVLLIQKLDCLEVLALISGSCTFVILEVDKTKLIQSELLQTEYEVAFTEANILFSGSIFLFLKEIEKYAEKETCDILKNKFQMQIMVATLREQLKHPEILGPERTLKTIEILNTIHNHILSEYNKALLAEFIEKINKFELSP